MAKFDSGRRTYLPPVLKRLPVSLDEYGILAINGSDKDDLVVVLERDCDIVVYMFRAGVLSTDTFCACKVSTIWFTVAEAMTVFTMILPSIVTRTVVMVTIF